VNVRSIIQRVGALPLASRGGLTNSLQEIDSLIEKINSGSHKKDEAQAPQVTPSPPEVLESPGPTNVSEEEEVPSHASDDASGPSHDVEEGDSDSTDEYTLEQPIYDEMDNVYRCANRDCGWEVVFGQCCGCHAKYMSGIVEVRQ